MCLKSNLLRRLCRTRAAGGNGRTGVLFAAASAICTSPPASGPMRVLLRSYSSPVSWMADSTTENARWKMLKAMPHSLLKVGHRCSLWLLNVSSSPAAIIASKHTPSGSGRPRRARSRSRRTRGDEVDRVLVVDGRRRLSHLGLWVTTRRPHRVEDLTIRIRRRRAWVWRGRR